jgi:hypothetical protein
MVVYYPHILQRKWYSMPKGLKTNFGKDIGKHIGSRIGKIKSPLPAEANSVGGIHRAKGLGSGYITAKIRQSNKRNKGGPLKIK